MTISHKATLILRYGLLLVHWTAFIFGASAQAAGVEYTSNMDKVEISLLTVGRGEAVYALYGHTILRVKDLELDKDFGYNWGIFDFHNSLFVWNFYRGKMRYQVAATPMTELLNHYEFREKRWVIEDRLRLTSLQKTKLLERLKWNEQPENIFYDYDQFKDNCATKPRDHLDFALGGSLQKRFGDLKTNKTFRDFIREGAQLNTWIYLGLDQVSNRLLDQPMTAWESMFIPSAFRNHLLELPAFDDAGQVIDDQKLLFGTKKLVDLKEPSAKTEPYSFFTLLIGFPAILLGVLTLKFSGVWRSFFRGTLWAFFGLYSGIFGLVLTLNHLVSGYPLLKGNYILLIHWPTDILFLLLGLGYLKKARHWPLKIYAAFHLISIVIAAYGWISGFIEQDILGSLATGGLLGFWVCLVSILGGANDSHHK